MAKSSEPKKTLEIDLTVTADNLEDDLFKIYSQLFEGVKKDDVIFEELKGGYVNSIQRLYSKKDRSKSLVFRTFGMKLDTDQFNKNINDVRLQMNAQENDQENVKPTEEVSKSTNEDTLAKQQTDDKSAANPLQQQNAQQIPDLDINTMFFNRLTEYLVMNEVSKYGLCQRVYAKYNNGICYGFTNGVTLNGPLMLTNDFLNEMATKLAKFHSIKYEVPNIKFKTHFERMTSQVGPMFEHMISVVDNYMNSVDEFPYNKFPKLANLIGIEQKIMGLLTEIGLGDIVFCHNDTNQMNIIWNSQERTLGFIDMEMSMSNYASMEMGTLFYFYTGHFLVDFNRDLFPSADYRRRFLRKYLEESNKLKGVQKKADEFERDLEKLFIQTNLTTLFFMLRMILMTPFFDVQPGFFKNDELLKAKASTKHYCGKFGYMVYELFDEIKDEFLKSAEDYLEKTKVKK